MYRDSKVYEASGFQLLCNEEALRASPQVLETSLKFTIFGLTHPDLRSQRAHSGTLALQEGAGAVDPKTLHPMDGTAKRRPQLFAHSHPIRSTLRRLQFMEQGTYLYLSGGWKRQKVRSLQNSVYRDVSSFFN